MYLSTLIQAFAAWRQYRAAVRQLADLDDRALRDIGVQRSQIESAVRGMIDPTYGRMM
jgi:uncharacterized protein YjiS (DUF1127 family)